jgi:phenylacetate-CoA ligase
MKAIVSSAETLWPHQRSLIEETFRVPVFDRYGCREVGQIASECSFHEGMHVSADRVLVEIVGETGKTAAPGEEGTILVTDLDNYGMPLIRYDIGDRATARIDSSCECGRGLPLLERIHGRTMDIIHTPDGRRVGGTFWTLLLRQRPGISRFQVVQDSPSGVTVYFVRGTEFESEVLDYFLAEIKKHCGADFQIDFVEKLSIEPSESGKQKLIVSNLKSDLEKSEQI